MNLSKSLIGSACAFLLATSCCWLPALAVGLGGVGSLIALSESMEKFSGLLMSIGTGLLAWGGFHYYQKKQPATMVNIQLQSIITCPTCQFAKEETMPTNACQFFYECEHCKTLLKPKAGDCCVYCSYGTVVCPPIQEGKNCC